MPLKLCVTSAAIAMSSFVAAQADTKWPSLPTHGFIRGRAAHKEDVDKGNASFVLDRDGVVVGKPLNISIPQYGCFNSPRTPVIVIQAEIAPDGHRIIGAKTLKGENMVGLLTEIRLMGSKPKGKC